MLNINVINFNTNWAFIFSHLKGCMTKCTISMEEKLLLQNSEKSDKIISLLGATKNSTGADFCVKLCRKTGQNSRSCKGNADFMSYWTKWVYRGGESFLLSFGRKKSCLYGSSPGLFVSVHSVNLTRLRNLSRHIKPRILTPFRHAVLPGIL